MQETNANGRAVQYHSDAKSIKAIMNMCKWPYKTKFQTIHNRLYITNFDENEPDLTIGVTHNDYLVVTDYGKVTDVNYKLLTNHYQITHEQDGVISLQEPIKMLQFNGTQDHVYQILACYDLNEPRPYDFEFLANGNALNVDVRGAIGNFMIHKSDYVIIASDHNIVKRTPSERNNYNWFR